MDWWFGAVPEDQVSWGTQENHNTVDADAAYVVRSDCYPYSEHYDPTREHFPCIPCSLTTGPKGAWMRANLEKAREEGGDRLKIYNYTAAVRLIHEEGKVTGVVAKDQTGNYIRVDTSKGVVLATGGFMNNERMLRHFLPAVYESGYGPEVNWYSVVDSEGNKCNTGDGHKMGIWAGGKMQTYGATMSHLISVSGTIGTMPLLWLDKNGKRFLNEDTQGQQFAEAVRQRSDRVAYQFLDAAYDDYHMDMPVGHGKTPAKTVADVEAKVDGKRYSRRTRLRRSWRSWILMPGRPRRQSIVTMSCVPMGKTRISARHPSIWSASKRRPSMPSSTDAATIWSRFPALKATASAMCWAKTWRRFPGCTLPTTCRAAALRRFIQRPFAE